MAVDVLQILICLSLICFALILLWYLKVPNNLPPGSAGLPVVGYLPLLNKPLYKTYTELAKKYGPVFHLYYGRHLIVILNDYNSIKETFIKQGHVFAGRIWNANFFEKHEEPIGIINSDGEHWKQHRRFVLSNLRDNGVGKMSLEPLLLSEIKCFLNELGKSVGSSTAVSYLLHQSVLNNINLLVTGNRYDYDDQVLHKATRSLINANEYSQEIPWYTFANWMAAVPGNIWGERLQIRLKSIADLKEIVKGIIKDNSHNKKHFTQYENLADAYNRAAEQKMDNQSTFSEKGLVQSCRELLSAGTDTSARTIQWGMIYLTNHQEIQRKVQEEIDRVIGREREPSYNDRTNTPYTVAMITEVHRVVSLVPVTNPHRTTKDTNVLGYKLPKNTIFYANLWGVHNDPKLWGDPENFRPERFIDAKGRLVVPEYLIPFSAGKRACAGEPLAKMAVYLYFTSILQNFNFVSPDGTKLPLDSAVNISRSPLHDKFYFTKRV